MSSMVIVGFDGSTSAHEAVAYGAHEARLRECELHLVHAFSWPLIYPPFGATYDPEDHGPRVAMLGVVSQAARDTERTHPGLTVRARVIDGSPGGVLVAASGDAELLVVGHRGTGGFAGLLAGSVSTQAAGHAQCPVVVVRGKPASAESPVVIGADGSPGALAAVEAAFAQAHRRGAELLAVHHRPPHGSRADAGAVAAGVRDVAGRHPDVAWRAEEVGGGDGAAVALMTVAESSGAGLVVVGSRGHGGLRAMVMGSTSRTLIEHAPCPVMVVPSVVHQS